MRNVKGSDSLSGHKAFATFQATAGAPNPEHNAFALDIGRVLTPKDPTSLAVAGYSCLKKAAHLLDRPSEGRNPTRPQCAAGPRTELPVSVPRPTMPRLADTPAVRTTST